VPDNTLSLLGSIQPGTLRPYIRAAVDGREGDDGLMQRVQLLVWPDMSPTYRYVDRVADRAAYAQAFEVYAHIARTTNPAETFGATPDPFDANARPYLHFDGEAQPEYDAWHIELEERVRRHDEHPAIEAHLSKFKKLVPALALIVHLAEGVRGPVGVVALRRALAWADYLESHARRVYAGVAGRDAEGAHALAGRLQRGALPDGFTARDVYQRGWGYLTTPGEARRAIEMLRGLGWLRETWTVTQGRPCYTYAVHPEVRGGRAA
jgi:uncharacterized protein DUF3987